MITCLWYFLALGQVDQLSWNAVIRKWNSWLDCRVRFSRSQSAAGYTRRLKSFGRCRRRGQCSGNGHQFGPAGQRIISVAIIGDLTSGGFPAGLGAECSARVDLHYGSLSSSSSCSSSSSSSLLSSMMMMRNPSNQFKRSGDIPSFSNGPAHQSMMPKQHQHWRHWLRPSTS